MLASALPSCWATFVTIASSSATASATARLNRSISAGTWPGSASICGSPDPNTESTRYATPDHDARADRNSLVHNTLSLAKPRSLAQT